jgi:hypothetical protein
MPTKTVTAVVDGREIEAVNTWFSGERLLVDGDVVAESQALFSVSESHPILEARFTGESGKTHYVEVYIAAVVTTRMMICVDGEYEAGDRMGTAEMFAQQRMQSRLAKQRAGARLGSPVAVPVGDREESS